MPPNLPTVSNSKHLMIPSLQRSQLGVGLIEVLIAVLVLSIGILGIAALQTTALSDNGSSLNKSAATAATYSILEGLRLDRANAVAGVYNQNMPVKTNACPAAGATLASYLINNWCTNQLGNFLGKTATAQGSINCTAAGACTIIIQFDDSKSTGGGNQFQLKTLATI